VFSVNKCNKSEIPSLRISENIMNINKGEKQLRKRITKVFLVVVAVVILILSLSITAAAAGNGNSRAGDADNISGSGQQNGSECGPAVGDRQQSGNCTGTCEGLSNQIRWQKNETQSIKLRSDDYTCTAPASESSQLSEEEIHWLTYMREEEKLARDIYILLYDQWDVLIFKNIAASEQKHMDAIERLLEKYGISDPVTDENISGNFTVSEFNTLYDNLKTRGLSSLDEAYRVGVNIEELDIEDLVKAVAASGEHPDLIRVYTNLLEGSNNHLDAFNSYLD
jgi:hypothetical protein